MIFYEKLQKPSIKLLSVKKDNNKKLLETTSFVTVKKS